MTAAIATSGHHRLLSLVRWLLWHHIGVMTCSCRVQTPQLSTSILGINLLGVRDGEISDLRALTLMEMSSLTDGDDISG